MLSVLVLLLVVAAASFAYRAFWMLRARPSSFRFRPVGVSGGLSSCVWA